MSLKLEKVDKNGQNLKFWMFQANLYLKTFKWSLSGARALKTDETLHFGGGGG